MPYNYTAIREMMVDAFLNVDDLNVFCSDYYYEVLRDFAPGDGLAARILKLLTRARHSNADLDQLLRLINKTRPDVYTRFESRLFEDEEEHDRRADEPNPNIAPALRMTREGLRDEPARYLAHFQNALDYIKVIHDYKQLHDYLHDLQYSWFPLISEEIRVFFDDTSEDKEAGPNLKQLKRDFDTYITDMKDSVESLREFNERQRDTAINFESNEPKKIEEERKGIKQLEEAQIALEGGLKENRQESVAAAKESINYVIDTLPSHINTKLYDEITEQTGRLRTLVALMNEELNKQGQPAAASERYGRLRKGIVALELLIFDMENLKREHDVWQGADNSLRMLNSFLQAELREKKISTVVSSEWRGLTTRVKVFYTSLTDKWAVELQELDRVMSERLEAASKKSIASEPLVEKESRRLRDAFQDYRTAGKDRFFRVDKLLLSNCEKLEKIRDHVD